MIDDLRDATTSAGAPSARNLLVTVFGDCIAPHGIERSVPVSALAAMLAHFSANERLVRTSLSRLVGDGVLAAHSIGRRSNYRVADGAIGMYSAAERRIYGRLGADVEAWDGHWTMATIDANTATGPARAAARNALQSIGMAPVTANVYAAARVAPATVHATLAQLPGSVRALVTRAVVVEAPGAIGAADVVGRLGVVDSVGAGYAAVVDRFGRYDLGQVAALDPAMAFKLRVLLVAAWRRVVLTDPILPAALLPAAWPADAARRIVAARYGAVAVASERYLADTVGIDPRSPAGRFA